MKDLHHGQETIINTTIITILEKLNLAVSSDNAEKVREYGETLESILKLQKSLLNNIKLSNTNLSDYVRINDDQFYQKLDLLLNLYYQATNEENRGDVANEVHVLNTLKTWINQTKLEFSIGPLSGDQSSSEDLISPAAIES